MADYPTIVYRCPGVHMCKGGTFNWVPVESDEQLLVALERGWHETLEGAMAATKAPAQEAEQPRRRGRPPKDRAA